MFVSRSRLTLHPLLSLFLSLSSAWANIFWRLFRNQLWCFDFLLEENRYNIPFVFLREWAPTSRELGWAYEQELAFAVVIFTFWPLEFGMNCIWCYLMFSLPVHSLTLWFPLLAYSKRREKSFLVDKRQLHLSSTTHLFLACSVVYLLIVIVLAHIGCCCCRFY